MDTAEEHYIDVLCIRLGRPVGVKLNSYNIMRTVDDSFVTAYS